jgi:hypothetical protein
VFPAPSNNTVTSSPAWSSFARDLQCIDYSTEICLGFGTSKYQHGGLGHRLPPLIDSVLNGALPVSNAEKTPKHRTESAG